MSDGWPGFGRGSRNAALQHYGWPQSGASRYQCRGYQRAKESHMLTFLRRLWIRWQSYHRVRNELMKLTNRELWDLGIRRRDIDRIAWEGAFKPHARC